MAIALRPLASCASMKSRYGSQALAEGLRLGRGSGTTVPRPESAPKSVDTSMAGFASLAAPTARRANWHSCRLQIRGCGFATDMDRSARCVVATSPAGPARGSCCFFSSLKTFTRRRVNLTSPVNVLAYFRWPLFRCPSMAGFGCPPRVGIPGDREGDSGMMPNARVNAESGMKPNSFRPIPEPRSASPESSLTPERRKSIAKKAAKARWGV